MRIASLVVCLWSVTAVAEMKPGLDVDFLVDRDADGIAETPVCLDGYGDYARFDRNKIELTVPQWDTPCDDIAVGELWQADLHGYFRFDNGDGMNDRISADLVCDVNDGMRATVFDAEHGGVVCAMELWQDVPSYAYYQSSDALDNAIWDVCSQKLVEGRLYEIEASFYHQSDTSVDHYMHNRATLQLWVTRVVAMGGHIEFMHDDDDDVDGEPAASGHGIASPACEVISAKAKTKAKGGRTRVKLTLDVLVSGDGGGDIDELIRCVALNL